MSRNLAEIKLQYNLLYRTANSIISRIALLTNTNFHADGVTMNKEKLIWIAVRTLGVIVGFAAINAISKAIMQCPLTFILFNSFDIAPESKTVVTMILIDQIGHLGTIIIAVYLLFFGKLAHRIINLRTTIENEIALTTEDIVSICVRTLGVWFLLKAAFEIVNFIESLAGLTISITMFKDIIAQGGEQSDFLLKMFDIALPSRFLTGTATLVGYLFVAWYLLYKGRFIVKLLSFIRTKDQIQTTE